MKLFKKIIAREFLFALSTVILFFVLLFIFHSISNKHMDKYDIVENDLEEMEERPYEDMPYRVKIYYYFKNEFGAYDLFKEIDSPKSFIEQLEDEKYVLTYFQFLQRHYPQDVNFEKYKLNITKDIAEQNSDRYIALLNSKKEELIDLRSSRFYNGVYGGRNVEDEDIFIILLVLLFGLRYLIYATTWSIRQVRTA